MDHEIEDDVDVERARSEDGEAVRFEKHGAGESLEGGSDGGVEALEVAGGEDAAFGVREGDEGVGFVEGGCEGLFDEDVEVGFEELCCDACVMEGGDGDRGGVKIEVGCEEFV